MADTQSPIDALREQVLGLRKEGRSIRAIASVLGVHRGQVERLLKPGRRTRRLPVSLVKPSITFDAPPFVGREVETAFLYECLERGLAGSGSAVLLSGEPGIGKTRLAEEMSKHAAVRNMRVVWGRCYESDGAPAYWPWIQVLRSLISEVDAEELRVGTGPAATYIAQVVPEMRQRLHDISPVGSLEPDSIRFLFFDSVVTFLKSTSQKSPLVLILEDLQGADEPSLLLLQFLANELQDAHMLLVGTYRDTALARSDSLDRALAELARGDAVHHVRLQGLDRDATEKFIALAGNDGISAPLVAALYEKTEGNPFFLREIIRLHLSQAAASPDGVWPELPVPATVSEVIGRRLQQVSKECRHVLSLAAVFGREFEMEPLRRIAGLDDASMPAMLEEAISARLLVRGSNADSLSFSHALIREVLYAEASATKQPELHRRAGEALEASFPANLEPWLDQIAHHFHKAGPTGAQEKRIEYARRAGDSARAKLAYEEAVKHYLPALEAMERAGGQDLLRCDLLLALGDTYSRLRDLTAADDALYRAADLAREAGATDRMALAVLGIGGWVAWTELLHASPRLVLLCRETLAALDGANLLKAKVQARLAGVLQLAGEMDEATALVTDALEHARGGDDEAVLAYVMEATMLVIWGATSPEARAPLVDELVRLTRRLGDREREFIARYWQVLLSLEAGDVFAADSEIDAMSRLAEELHQPTYRLVVRTLQAERAMLDGRFDDAEALIGGVAAELSETRRQSEVLVANNAMQMLALRRERGGLEAMEPALAGFAHEYPDMPVIRVLLTYLYCETGKRQEAREQFETLAADDFAGLPRDIRWPFAMGILAEICGYLGDPGRAAVLYRMLLPCAGRNITIVEDFCTGSASLNLGVLAATMQHWDAAAGHFEAALEMNVHMGARPALAHTRYLYACALLSRRSPANYAKAVGLLKAAHDAAREMGMRPLLKKIEAALQASKPAMSHPAGLTTRELDVLRLLAAGRSNREIAGELVLSERTVERHISSVYAKIDARGRAAATAFALKNGVA